MTFCRMQLKKYKTELKFYFGSVFFLVHVVTVYFCSWLVRSMFQFCLFFCLYVFFCLSVYLSVTYIVFFVSTSVVN